MAAVKRRAIETDERRRRPVTLGDLGNESIDVFCWCNRCGHDAVVGIDRLIKELGPSFPVPEAGTRMRCTGCGSKDVATRPAWPSLGQVARHG
jgi:hypothetical protein